MGRIYDLFVSKYNYTDFHELNLDWLIAAIKQFEYELENFVSINAVKYADPIQWDITRQYEKNTIVIDPITGTAYISSKAVPIGIALSREDYWNVVFDLGRFITLAAQNFANTYESVLTTTATKPTDKNGWIVWNSILYQALDDINIGDAYVPDEGGNIARRTVEDFFNTLDNKINNETQTRADEDTRIELSLTNLINSRVNAEAQTREDEDIRIELSLTDLINSRVNAEVQTRENEDTRIELSLTDLINSRVNVEAYYRQIADDTLNNAIGRLNDLQTSTKTSTVGAINEVLADVNSLNSIMRDICIPKNRQIIIIADSYGMRNTPNFLDFLTVRYPDNIRGKALSSYGFTPFIANNKNFYSILYDYFTSQMVESERNKITDVVYLGGWNDAHQIALGNADGSSILSNIHNTIRATTTDFPNARVWVGFTGWQSHYALIGVPQGEIYPTFANLRSTELVYTSFCYPNGYVLDACRYIMRDPFNIDETYFHPNGTGAYYLAYSIIGELFGHWKYNQTHTIDNTIMNTMGVITNISGSWTIANENTNVILNIRCNGNALNADGVIGFIEANKTIGVTEDNGIIVVGVFSGTVNDSPYTGGMLCTLGVDGGIYLRLPDLTAVSSVNGRFYGRASWNNKYN